MQSWSQIGLNHRAGKVLNDIPVHNEAGFPEIINVLKELNNRAIKYTNPLELQNCINSQDHDSIFEISRSVNCASVAQDIALTIDRDFSTTTATDFKFRSACLSENPARGRAHIVPVAKQQEVYSVLAYSKKARSIFTNLIKQSQINNFIVDLTPNRMPTNTIQIDINLPIESQAEVIINECLRHNSSEDRLLNYEISLDGCITFDPRLKLSSGVGAGSVTIQAHELCEITQDGHFTNFDRVNHQFFTHHLALHNGRTRVTPALVLISYVIKGQENNSLPYLLPIDREKVLNR